MASDQAIHEINQELRHWPYVDVKFETTRGNHRRAILSFRGKTEVVTFPSTASDVRSAKNTVRHIKAALKKLGAHRNIRPPVSKREVEEMVERHDVKIGINTKNITVSIPETHKLFGMLLNEDRSSKDPWRLELRSNPNLKGEPFLAIVRTPPPPGKKMVPGSNRAAYNKMSKAAMIAAESIRNPRILEKFGEFGATPSKIRTMGENEIVFELPKEKKALRLRGDRKLEKLTSPEPPEPAPEPEVVQPEPVIEPPTSPPSGIDMMQTILAALQNNAKPPEKMLLQLPERPLTVERCIAYLNQRIQSKTKRNLRVEVDPETGLLSYIEKGGPKY